MDKNCTCKYCQASNASAKLLNTLGMLVPICYGCVLDAFERQQIVITEVSDVFAFAK